jgi:hypothetical protein
VHECQARLRRYPTGHLPIAFDQVDVSLARFATESQARAWLGQFALSPVGISARGARIKGAAGADEAISDVSYMLDADYYYQYQRETYARVKNVIIVVETNAESQTKDQHRDMAALSVWMHRQIVTHVRSKLTPWTPRDDVPKAQAPVHQPVAP